MCTMKLLTVSDVTSKLLELGIDHVVDHHSLDIDKVVGTTSRITLVTSDKAARLYDHVHPERIVAFLVVPHSHMFRVIVNNRTFDLGMLKFWCEYSIRLDVGATCDICYNKLNTYFHCSMCSGKFCAKCNRKLCLNDDDSYKCPLCQKWNMPGTSFGLTFDLLNVNAQSLKSLLTSLDGETTVLVRIDRAFIDRVHVMSRLFYSKKGRILTRPASDQDDAMLTKLLSFVKKQRQATASPDFMVYILRKTFLGTEASAVRIGPDNHLFQYSVDAWPMLFDCDQKVAYLTPYDFAKDVAFNVMDTVPSVDKSYTCSLSFDFSNDDYINFDVENNVIVTMHVDMLNACMSTMLAANKDIVIKWSCSNVVVAQFKFVVNTCSLINMDT